MASEKFNTLSGITVGIPPIDVVNQTGNIVSNFNNPNGNVTANLIFAGDYRLVDGTPFVGNFASLEPAGPLTDLDETVIIQSGIPKKVSLSVLKTYFNS